LGGLLLRSVTVHYEDASKDGADDGEDIKYEKRSCGGGDDDEEVVAVVGESSLDEHEEWSE
jgi:hypothetical protein